ncbi:hypothetical protein VTN77DRAFT_9296 [Rasamsonia byssochlamydoides]|uniref:uncharacterized protein n=1 Tax=Rasamsonia byssochlamydoides TaxID=89139 RepID=UPI003743EAAC
MSVLFHLLLACSTLFTSSSALPSTSHQPVPSSAPSSSTLSTPLPPSKDPWYTAPPDYESARPGTVLRIRPAPGNLTSVLANTSAVYNILYRTTDSHYKPSWAVTTLLIPSSQSHTTANTSKRADQSKDLLSYAIPYDAADVDASPSYAFYSLYEGTFGDLSAALSQGWYVNVPDYEGPLASFTAGVQSGHATIDSIRAVLASGLGLGDSTRSALWGYSGGALANEWAAELQVQYAPELTFSGADLGGLTPNVTSVIESVNGQYWAGLIPLGLLGVASQYPEVMFLATKNITWAEAIATFMNQDISDYFVNGEAYVQAQMPLFVYKAIADEISPIGETDALVDKYCAVGANILYQRNMVGGHLAEYTNGDARAFEWLRSVLEGTYTPASGCTIQNVTVNVTSTAL